MTAPMPHTSPGHDDTQLLIAGSGKLAMELLSGLAGRPGLSVAAWHARDAVVQTSRPVVVHAGSGRELDEIIEYCRAIGAPLVELSTGTGIAQRALGLAVVECPNTNILMLKFMLMLSRNGHLFQDNRKQLLESHQAGKTSTPGTAVSLAHYLGMAPGDIISERDPAVQAERLGIPPEHLSRHAFHRIVIEEPHSSITLETRVEGPAPYVDGVARIVAAVAAQPLEPRHHDIIEFIDKGWV